MSTLPRIALGTMQSAADGTAMAWALADLLARGGLRVQSFLSQAAFAAHDGATALTGLAPRHLDSWLMSPSQCRAALARGLAASDLALVEGRFDVAPGQGGGDLGTLCQWLDMPRVAIVDARLLERCQLPNRPRHLHGLLLDRVADTAEACRLQTLFEALWNVPLLGWLGPCASLRHQMATLPCGARPPAELGHALGNELSRTASLVRLCRLACRRADFCVPSPRPSQPPRALRVAVACDDAFGGYFPETLELLEAGGATICDFSPLNDERLPSNVDVVYLGSGHPELYAEALSANHCLMLALKSHLCAGRRMYAECGSLAYLCDQIETKDGQRWPMAGVLPGVARLDGCCRPPQAAEVTASQSTWLAPAGERLRGYRNPRWTLSPLITFAANGGPCGFADSGPVEPCALEPGYELDVVRRHQAVGSRLHLNFAAQPNLLERFFSPCPAAAPALCARSGRWV